MECYQFIDFGSTYTKVTLVDIEKEEILANAKAYTTVESDVTIGYENALEQIYSKVNKDDLKIKKITACSSAAGGLKVVAIGLVPELTAEAAKRAALGAGARILNTYSFNLNDDELNEIKNCGLDIILLAGGTDGGNEECILHNAKMIAKHNIEVPVVVAGNKSVSDKIKEIFDGKVEYYITENVMPNLKKINVDPARETIRNIFMKNIVKAKGMERIHEFLSDIAMPTPAAVLRAARVLSEGTEIEDGIGDLVVVDIGGATTDIHSLADGYPSQPGVMMRGLEEPFAKRTVEGDLGMRYSAMAVFEAAGLRTVKKYIDTSKYENVEDEFAKRFHHTDFLAETQDEIDFDIGMAQICARLSMHRHAGTISEIFSPVGKIYNQEGKDLLKIPFIIGTGGVIINNENPTKILSAAKFSPEDPQSLRPENPRYLVDKSYILSSMGLLSMIDADMAVRMMKKYLIEV